MSVLETKFYIGYFLLFSFHNIQERADKIRESSLLLKKKRITDEQFLDRILHITKKFNDDGAMQIIDSEESEQQNESDQQDESDQEDESDTQISDRGKCIACAIRQCEIILVPCFHIVICSSCWQERVIEHESQCDILFKSNKRKLIAEKKKVTCPCCSNVVGKAQPFYMATISQT